ncbi:MAG TPA: nitrophenyl compound nitroreductase subunit ArsF family protein [Elusimicrobiales bacterium]|nr:nitrophenyl compound nitroreductase subunit ArsF family protein [Elusimicrobiales bacterium]
MQKNSSEEKAPKGPPKAVKALLMGFVALSVAAGVYKIANSPCCDAYPEETVSAPVAAPKVPAQAPAPVQAPRAKAQAPVAAAPAPVPSARPVPVAAAPEPAAAPRSAEPKKAMVYYFYTSARCYSCNLIERYTREAVENNFREPYKGWQVDFLGVNLDGPGQKHFVSDYRLTNKSVVVQKFDGEKPGEWKNLQDVWRMLGNQELFTGYVVGEIQGLLDAK